MGVESDLSQALDALAAALPEGLTYDSGNSEKIRTLLDEELQYRRDSDAFPLVPQRVVSDVRTALDRHDDGRRLLPDELPGTGDRRP
ncbi:hypothetical protein OHB00_40015 [Streptomyces sp. NBC_00631]|uniref:hypothetical protein n=1 Tax=Streptomyces sp. NBC_00631 TaxID=2975793 RepID=UPI0030E520DB